MKTDEDLLKELRKQKDDFRSGKRKQYPEPLDEPLFVDESQLPPTEDIINFPEKDEWEDQLRYAMQKAAELDSRWQILCGLYDIDTAKLSELEAWRQLATALAKRHVPGMRLTNTPPKQKRGPGAPKVRDPNKFIMDLVVSIDEARARYARNHKKPIEKVSVETGVRNLGKEFFDRWKTSKGRPWESTPSCLDITRRWAS